MNSWMSDIKLFLLNASTFVISFSAIDMTLKLLLLIVSIGYTINKWLLLRKKNDQDKEEK
jgi:hypothetical protein